MPATTIALDKKPSPEQPVDFELLFKTAPSLYVVLKPDFPHFTILAANDAYAKATHTTLDGLVGNRLLDVFPANPDDSKGYGKGQVFESLEYVTKHSEPHIIPMVRYDVRRLPEEGGGFVIKYWTMVTTPVLGPGGDIEYIIHRVEDVTEKKRIRDERQRFFDEGADMVMIGSFDGYLKHVNPAWETVLGWSDAELTSTPWIEFVHPDDRKKTLKIGESLLAGIAIPKFENRYRCKDGTYRWLRWKVKPFVDEQLIYGGAADVTDYKKIEAELVNARDHAEAANIAKTDFLSNMSHEIRTPMNAVIGLANILAISQPLSPKQREFVKTLQLSADSLLALINDMLDIAKIEARTVDLEKVPFSLSQLIQEVTSIMGVRVREKGLKFDVDIECIQDRMFIGDPTRLRQIIMNLCSNAVKFTEEGGIHIDIRCTPLTGENAENICIIVKDTGIGIAAEKIDTIFQKFVQADTSINRKYGGTGLGLAITKTLTEIMDGTIHVKSVVGTGSTFTVCIPMEIARETVEKLPSQDSAQAKEPLDSSRKTGPRILLVEDYAPNVLVATTFIEQFGYTCEIATNGQEAIEKVKTGRFSLILMDVQMHGMNGLEATHLIRAYEQQQKLERIPIIGMTAHALSGDRERCLGAGMDDYIPKPFNPDELRGMIENALIISRV
jgi:PAS domain S-box-containing protein